MDINPQDAQLLSEKTETMFDFKRILGKILFIWPWILLSICLGMSASWFYLRYKTPLYNITARILVNDDKKGGVLGQNDVLGDMGGLLGAKNSVDNEVEILKTKDLLRKVVLDMRLNVRYFKKGNIRDIEFYNSPFSVVFLKEADTIYKSTCVLKPLANAKLSLKTDVIDTVVNYDKPIFLKNIGLFQIHRNGALLDVKEEYSFSINSVDAEVSDLLANITVAATNTQVTIIDLSMKHPIPRKGEDVLNKLIQKYVQGNIDDKNIIADSTIKFIKNRLAYIGGELGDLEGNIQGFKERNKLVEMSEQTKMLVQNTAQYVKDLSQIETQLNILKSLKDYLNDESRNKRVLPSSILLTDAVFNGLVERYNRLLLERDNLLISVTETNPQIVNLDAQIINLRSDLLSNLENTQRTLTINRDGLRKQMANIEGDMKQVPEVERNYLELARQQQIKQQLYLFLMQKNEETEISKTANLSNSKVIDSPKSDVSYFSPKRPIVLLIGFIVGLLVPMLIVYLRELMNTRVESKADISKITEVSIIGEISHDKIGDNLVTASNSRSAISEQFRALRTNLAFYLRDKDEKIILLTSSMSGEGKSFVAINLGNILALTGKKVLLMELDLRKPGLSYKLGMSNTNGFTNYSLDENLKIENLIKPLDIHPNLFLLSSGPIPPNPAETIMSSRTDALMNELRTQFDYIIIDAPPIGLVTDAQLLSKYASLCLYLVRQNYTFKEQINIIQNLYINKKMRKMGIVINDIQQRKGYGYGYGYGYGEYGADMPKQNWLQRLLSKAKKS
ncbi:GumC family protein [Pedobacter kyonggii]|uniref:Polysaccharide biosynthesis tyrosine autokinase n=1 Tax=Pedobacter kyonggii TaxID=1926871 RepID=A0A4Q9HFG7_9SPHI|nr:tyrosine-protein kinase [Pedobacter kyonggii]TBO43321.1 polysaccharide biosynthesis tyrosine autokinase [Pedobacter kyonggii]